MGTSRKYRAVNITMTLTAELNQLLTESAERSSRGKVKEALMRLNSHLKKYKAIASIDEMIAFEEGDVKFPI